MFAMRRPHVKSAHIFLNSAEQTFNEQWLLEKHMSAAHSLILGPPFCPLQSNYVTSLIPDIVISNFKIISLCQCYYYLLIKLRSFTFFSCHIIMKKCERWCFIKLKSSSKINRNMTQEFPSLFLPCLFKLCFFMLQNVVCHSWSGLFSFE